LEGEGQCEGSDEQNPDDEVLDAGELASLMAGLVLCEVIAHVVSFGQEGLFVGRDAV